MFSLAKYVCEMHLFFLLFFRCPTSKDEARRLPVFFCVISMVLTLFLFAKYEYAVYTYFKSSTLIHTTLCSRVFSQKDVPKKEAWREQEWQRKPEGADRFRGSAKQTTSGGEQPGRQRYSTSSVLDRDLAVAQTLRPVGEDEDSLLWLMVKENVPKTV